MTSEHISRSLRFTLGEPRAFGATLRCPELVLAQFWYDLGRSRAPLRETWGHLGGIVRLHAVVLGTPGSLGGPMAVPKCTFVGISYRNIAFVISVIDAPSGDP